MRDYLAVQHAREKDGAPPGEYLATYERMGAPRAIACSGPSC